VGGGDRGQSARQPPYRSATTTPEYSRRITGRGTGEKKDGKIFPKKQRRENGDKTRWEV